MLSHPAMLNLRTKHAEHDARQAHRSMSWALNLLELGTQNLHGPGFRVPSWPACRHACSPRHHDRKQVLYERAEACTRTTICRSACGCLDERASEV